jgi:methylenetetrahydrofolate dehydrogenase (NADP+)/methenyltetrahydrofolate cyclohydrolase
MKKKQMLPTILDGKATAAAIRAGLKADMGYWAAKAGRAPGLAVILVGDDPASQVYVRFKERACEETGILSEVFRLPQGATQSELLDCIQQLNDRNEIDGILVQLPLPARLDSQEVVARIRPDKDVDGFTAVNMGRLALALPGLRPCTPAGIIALLEHYKLSPSGKRAVVIGRSNIVGRPLAMLLSGRGAYGNATVTVCHSGTKGLSAICREADFLFPALGRPEFVTADMVKPGAVIVDVGINRTEKGLVGDVDYKAVAPLCSAITPVPGGVGPMTIAQLLVNTVNAWKARCGLTTS